MNILHKNLLILASAGSGKTFQLGNRVIGLVAKGIPPEKIVALTFTRKAAGEFADSVLMKLAGAAEDPGKAEALRRELDLPDADFSDALKRIVHALPRFTLGTMDSFFARVVRGFQYELGLTGGKFELLEGQRAEAVRDEILAELLSEPLEEGTTDELLHVFRRATIGKEGAGVAHSLRHFVDDWHGKYRADSGQEWGPSFLALASLDEWEEKKHTLAEKISRDVPNIAWTDKRQAVAVEKLIRTLSEHTIGSGSLEGATSLLASVLEACAEGSGSLQVKFYNEFTIGGVAGSALREMVTLAARCEMAAALLRTKAVREAVEAFDRLCERKLRRRGLLGFDDVKILMGGWASNEDARLRREAVDFRLDARYEHWLLDEFQDTSGADWMGLQPLIDEAAAEGEGSMFIVGDRKQAIYGWRGGEVGLFDEVRTRYGGGLEIEQMAESWRSCPQVLELVNRVCGDVQTMTSLFGEAAERWEWEPHFSAEPLTAPGKRGESRVEVVGDWEERLDRTASLLREMEVSERALTCGVLVRSNKKVQEVADYLREQDFEVIEEGQREPGHDNPVGVVLVHLLKWLADPADAFAKEVIAMSPLAAVLSQYGDSWQAIWERISAIASDEGYAPMVERIVEPCWSAWSDFGRRRAGDLIAALTTLDAQGGTTPREAADWLDRLKISQSPGVAAVQVMTIHKSKGLGFDVVVIPDIPNDVIPSARYFTMAEGDGWITQPPAKWARRLFPELVEAEERWAAAQRYESFCMLYVALTRAKRALHVLLEPPSKNAEGSKASLANWVATSVDSSGEPGIVYQCGSSGWQEEFPLLAEKPIAPTEAPLGEAVPRRERTTPSTAKATISHSFSNGGMKWGNDLHQAMEAVGWIDDESPALPKGRTRSQVHDLLANDSIRALFLRDGRKIELYREQAVEAVIGEKWLTGTIDRLHVHRDASGIVVKVEIIDFKTDAVESSQELLDRYAGQMTAYREVMAHVYPGAMIDCLLVSTTLRDVILAD